MDDGFTRVAVKRETHDMLCELAHLTGRKKHVAVHVALQKALRAARREAEREAARDAA